ncbi:MAG TPA: hypothetical protein VJM32_05140 [Candidatus Saccharimonadales bacterium]|nr:hypothetical protein [Candidatus Saccharimonadales bacterium]
MPQYDNIGGSTSSDPAQVPPRPVRPVRQAPPIQPVSAPPVQFQPPLAPRRQGPPPADQTAQFPPVPPVQPRRQGPPPGDHPTAAPHTASHWATAILAVASWLCCWGYGVGIVLAIGGLIASHMVSKIYKDLGQPVPADMKIWKGMSWAGLVLGVFGTFASILIHFGSMASVNDSGM